jgi:endogenous inhibitor of DNA gyrase (YacG/DUF329 family)
MKGEYDMAIAKCPKCGNSVYFKEEENVGVIYEVAIVRCSKCGTAIGTTLPDWALEVLERLDKKI